MDVTTAITQMRYMIQEQKIMLDSSSATLTEAIQMAVGDYSRDKPFTTVQKLQGNGTSLYDLPSTFSWDFSTLTSVEYPLDKIPKSYLDKRYYQKYRGVDGATPQLVLLNTTPNGTEYFNVEYTKFSADVEDVRTEDERAVLALSCHHACIFAATKMTQQANDNRNVDFSDRGAQADTLLRIAEMFLKTYTDRVFGKEEANSPMSTVENIDTFFNRKYRRILNPQERT